MLILIGLEKSILKFGLNNNISINAGSNTISWASVPGASSYNIYASTSSYGVAVPVGVLYGYIGTSYGGNFVDTNITADFTITPPIHNNPFSRGAIIAVTPTAAGQNYGQNTVGYTINTSTGSGFVGQPVIVGNKLADFIIQNGGQGYQKTDTITITDSGIGSGATAQLSIGPETGTYPSVAAYYQQRIVYANTINNPDTYYMSQPGAFNNMDASIPVTDSDAIVGTPWAQQVNGVQFMVPMPGGLVMYTGNGVWQVNGGNSADITPSDQTAIPQASGGCGQFCIPIPINYSILFVESKQSLVYELEYNFFAQIYLRTDKTVLSNQLFYGFTFQQWGYAEQPYKLIWMVRNDGVMLSFTYLKEQDIYGWARHDTNGLFVGVCPVTEPPVDAIYVITQRYVQGAWRYYSERMDDRLWNTVEDSFCVDAGLAWPMTSPAATLNASSATGSQNITSAFVVAGGTGYTAPVAFAIDPTGEGSGATFTVTVSGGVITAVTPVTNGQNYQVGTQIAISDATGTGAIVNPVITNNATFTASSGVFNSGMVGDVIRMGGGKATIVTYTSSTTVVANITQDITQTIPNDPNNTPLPATSGNWTISTPTTVVTGLNHLEGLTVSILADGSVVDQQVVTNNSITLPHHASSIVVGLPYTCQLQTMYLNPPGQNSTGQNRRKNIYSVGVRMQASRGISVGTNQIDASTQQDNANVPWVNMKEVKERNALVTAGSAIPLYTGDIFINVPADWNTNGQVAVQQTYPLPASIIAIIPYHQLGDTQA